MQLSQYQLNNIKQYFAGIPVMKAYLFGSYSRTEADEESDIDILVELDYSQNIGLKFFTYQNDLSNLLHKKVDIVTNDGLSPHIKNDVDKEKILIYEKPANG